jgi:hypothetical protein
MGRNGLALAAVAAVLAAVGCAGGRRADRAATPADLVLDIQPVGLPPAEGGLPAALRLSARNRSGDTVGFAVPRPVTPLAPKPPGAADLPLPILALFLRDAAGHEESPLWADRYAKTWPKAVTVALGPGETWSAEYRLTDFYFWGTTGPDVMGDFTRYFGRGPTDLALAAGLVFGQGQTLRSDAVSVRCAFEGWLFRRKPAD